MPAGALGGAPPSRVSLVQLATLFGGLGLLLGYAYARSTEARGSRLPAPCDAPRLAALSAKASALRLALGELSCETRGIGPTGGFCLKEGEVEVGGNQAIDLAVAAGFGRLLAGKSVTNFGAGLGQYERYFDSLAADAPRPASSWACDGAENINKFAYTRGDGTPYVSWCDLTEPVEGAPISDYVMSIEVAEHIPPSHVGAFVQNVVSHARTGILLSWAKPEQGGHFHVNPKEPNEMAAVFAAEGWVVDEGVTASLRALAAPEKEGGKTEWLGWSLFVLRRAGA